MAKIFEVRYRDGDFIFAHQHASEHFAKIDAKEVSKQRGRCMLGEMDYDNNNIIRACEYAGGVQSKWENRSGNIIPCKILLTLEDTKQTQEPEVEAKPKVEYTDEEKAKKKAALAAIREAQAAKEKKPEKVASEPKGDDRKEKLIKEGYEPELANVICVANLHSGSPNFGALVSLWKGQISEDNFPTMKPKDVNQMMAKLRALLISNGTGKSIATKTVNRKIIYSLINYKIEILDEEVV